MTTPKIRALQALADATDRPFLATAPLMAVVEAVQVLDAAGLLASGVVVRPATDAARALREYPNASAAAEEAMRNGIIVAVNLDNEEDIRDQLQKMLDRVEVTDAALVMCELVDDAQKAKAVLDDEGFHGRTLEAQVRALLVAWSAARDAAATSMVGAPVDACPDCGVVAGAHLGGCAWWTVPAEPTPCQKCGVPLTPTGMCMNFPACPDSTIPF